MAVEDIENDKDQELLETDSRPKILDLPRTEDEWHAIFDFLSDVIMVLDKDGRILKANKAALEYLDLPLERIIGSFCFKIIHGTEGPVAGCPTMRMLESHQYEEADLYLESKGFCARVMTYPLWPDKGDEVQFIHVIRNIDSHIRIEEVLRKRVKELDCLYEISRLIESKSSSVESILEEIPKLIPAACQYPKIAAAKLAWEDREFMSPNWKETPWILKRDILTYGKTVGVLQVAYLAERPDHPKEPFLPEEKKLIHAISERIGHVIERHSSDVALRDSEERYRIHFDNISDVSYSLDQNMVIQNISPSVERMLGYLPEELIGRKLVDASILGAESHRAVMMDIMRVFAGERTESSPYEFLSRDGVILMGEVSSAPLQRKGKVVGVISVARDVSKRYRTEQELKRINALLSTQQETSPNGILVVDEKGKIISFNRRFLEIWNMPPEFMAFSENERELEAASKKVVDPEGFLSRIRHLYENRNERSRDEILLKDGRILERYSAPMVGEDGHFYGRVWYYHDITQRKQTEEKIIQANEKLKATVNKLEERNFHNSILSEMREMLQACSSVTEVPSIIRGSMTKLFPHTDGALFMVNALRTELERVLRWDDFPGDVDENIFPFDACWALRRGRAHLVEDAGIGPVCPHLKQPPANPYVCLPLVAKGEVLGMLHLRCKQPFDNESCQKMVSGMKDLASTISEYLSLSIANIQLRERLAAQSIRDPLTGLFNRRYMEESLQQEIQRAERKKTAIGIVMADIDHFKLFNDRYGHAAGDELLAHVGEFLKSKIRGADVACRYGGDEFILFLPESSVQDTCRRADKIREEAQSLEVRYRNQTLESITLSFGIAIYPDHGIESDVLLRAADAALYKAKQEGRNRIVVS